MSSRTNTGDLFARIKVLLKEGLFESADRREDVRDVIRELDALPDGPYSRDDVLEEAARLCREEVILCDDDREYDNTRKQQDGDGTAFNRGVIACDRAISALIGKPTSEAGAERAPANDAANDLTVARAKAYMENQPIYNAALAAAGAVATALKKNGVRICDCGSAPQGICCCGAAASSATPD